MLKKPLDSRHPSGSILIVEDNKLLLELLSTFFKKSGWQVIEAENGLSGWDIFQRKRIDIVLTDVRMPGLDGIALAHKVRNASPKTKIALMSGTNDNGAISALIEDGIVDFFFQKPFPLSQARQSLMTDCLP